MLESDAEIQHAAHDEDKIGWIGDFLRKAIEDDPRLAPHRGQLASASGTRDASSNGKWSAAGDSFVHRAEIGSTEAGLSLYSDPHSLGPIKEQEALARTQRQFTDDETQLVRRMRDARATTAEIAKALGASESTVKRRLAGVLGERPRGPAPTVWSERERHQVAEMASFGIPRDKIARVMGVSPDRLRAEFADELETGSTLANCAIAGTLFEMATKDRIPAAAIFWAKARMGWRDRDPIRVTEPIPLSAEAQRAQQMDLRAAVRSLSVKGREALRVVMNDLGAKSQIPGGSVSVHDQTSPADGEVFPRSWDPSLAGHPDF